MTKPPSFCKDFNSYSLRFYNLQLPIAYTNFLDAVVCSLFCGLTSVFTVCYVMSLLHTHSGLKINAASGKASDPLTMRGGADSFYKYLIKGWIQGNETELQLPKAFLDAVIESKRTLTHAGIGPCELAME